MTTINIEAMPPTAEVLQLQRKKSLTNCALFSALVLPAVALPMWIWRDELSAVPALAVLLAVIVFAGIASAFMGVFDAHEELPEAWCSEFHDNCKSTPEGNVYRAEVLKQGRKFIKAEFYAMNTWAEGRAQRDACKSLYDIPQL